jgi:hypothetical protein
MNKDTIFTPKSHLFLLIPDVGGNHYMGDSVALKRDLDLAGDTV